MPTDLLQGAVAAAAVHFTKISYFPCFGKQKATRFRLDLSIHKTCLFPSLVNMKLSSFLKQIITVACMSEKKITRKKFNLRIHRNVKFFMWGLWICVRELNWLAGLCWVTLVESGKVSVWFVWCCCVSCVYKDDGDDKKRATKRQLENNVHINIICDCYIISVAIFVNHVTVRCIVRTFPCYFLYLLHEPFALQFLCITLTFYCNY